MAITMDGKNRIMIHGPKEDGTYVVEFKTAAGEAMAISIPRTEAAVIRHFQERMPYGLFVPEVPFQGQPFSWGSGAQPLREARFRALAPLFCQDAAWSKIIMSRFRLPSRQSYPGEGW
jgi:hypothetical protein